MSAENSNNNFREQLSERVLEFAVRIMKSERIKLLATINTKSKLGC